MAFEGPDGSGKSTQARAFAAAWAEAGHSVHLTREPGGTDLGERLRSLVLDPEHAPIDPRTEALLFSAARAAHVHRCIRPALASGTTVVTDRFIDSSVAYQGVGRGLGPERIAELNRWAVDGTLPDLTVVLDLDAETAAARRTARQDTDGTGPDRLEQETAHTHEQLRGSFLEQAAAAPERYLVLDATTPIEQRTAEIRARLEQIAAGRGHATRTAPATATQSSAGTEPKATAGTEPEAAR